MEPITERPAADLNRLNAGDPATIVNALEFTNPEGRATGFTTGTMVCALPELKPVCGFARTATIRAVSPSLRSAAENLAGRQAYYEYVATRPGPTIVVIQDQIGRAHV